MKRIAILMFWKEKTKGRYYTLSTDIYHRLEELGIFPIMIPNGAINTPKLIEKASGLLIPGGPDICPDMYGAPLKGARDYSKEQDNYSLETIDLALKKQIPIFGICRGMQLLNIYFGGTLIQDIKTYDKHHQFEKRYQEVHDVTIHEGTLLHQVFKTTKIGVNSLHHQAIKVLGTGLIVSANDTEDARIIEGIENSEKQVYGVQWHPEKFQKHSPLLSKIFDI